MVVAAPTLPRPGQTVVGGTFYVAPGGKGANQAVAAARCASETRVTFVGAFGDDEFGRAALRGLKDDGIDCTHCVRVEGVPSGVALIFVDARGENMIAVAPGANGALKVSHVARAKAALHAARVALVQLESPLPAVAKTLALARSRGVRTILNPAPAPAKPLTRSLLSKVDILTPNETEFAALTGVRPKGSKGAAAAAKLAKSLGEALIVTRGAEGVRVFQKDGQGYSVPAFSVTPVDAVAAGDAFSGALAVGLAERMGLKAAISFASAVAAISVTRRGAQPSLPTRKDVVAFLKKARAR
jgi:ribokinase